MKEMFNTHLENAIKEARGIAYNISPPDLDEGFLHAVGTLSERVNRVGNVKLGLHLDPSVSEEDFAHVDKFNLYRIVQEFLNNSFKHSGSQKIDLRIEKEGSTVRLTADDHGKGFDMSEQTVGLGVKSLLHRIKLGELNGGIKSAPGNGTQLELNLN
jgi:signal transduction histidine kinase